MTNDFEFMEDSDVMESDAIEQPKLTNETSLADLLSESNVTDSKDLDPSDDTPPDPVETKEDDKPITHPTIVVSRRMLSYAKRARLIFGIQGSEGNAQS